MPAYLAFNLPVFMIWGTGLSSGRSPSTSVRDELARKSAGAKPIFQLPVACAGATSSRKPPSVFAAQN
jgi:hypothetical protein